MGYNVAIVKSTARIPKSKLAVAYEKMCALNITHDSQKRGGSWSGGQQVQKWFSWMDANYPDTCPDARAVLEMLGFYTDYNDEGDLLIEGYDSKTGQEDLFLKAIENDAAGEILWTGEEHERWTTTFHGDNVFEAEAPVKLLT
jgi:hypothetical protein